MQLDGAREKTLYAKWQYFHRSLFNHDRLLGERKEGVDIMESSSRREKVRLSLTLNEELVIQLRVTRR